MGRLGVVIGVILMTSACVHDTEPPAFDTRLDAGDMYFSILDAAPDGGMLDAQMEDASEMLDETVEDEDASPDAMTETDADLAEDAEAEMDAQPPCLAREFDCGDDECIPESWVCNDRVDCTNGLDEEACVDASLPDMEMEDAFVEDAAIEDAGVNVPGENARVSAGQRQGTVLRGNVNGGNRYDDGCPGGQVLIGFAGAIRPGASYLGQLQTICGEVRFTPDGPTTQNGMVFPVRGAQGVMNFNLTCPAGYAVYGYGGRGGLLVDQLFLHCAELVVEGDRLVPGEAAVTAPAGGQGGGAFADVFCPMDTFATGGIIRAGDGIDAVGIACSPLSIME